MFAIRNEVGDARLTRGSSISVDAIWVTEEPCSAQLSNIVFSARNAKDCIQEPRAALKCDLEHLVKKAKLQDRTKFRGEEGNLDNCLSVSGPQRIFSPVSSSFTY